MKKKYFGTDGIRGRVGASVIHPEFMLKLGFALGTTLQAQSAHTPTVLIGRDTRDSGEMLQFALQSGLIASGVNVSLLNVLSTPAIAFLTKTAEADAGIVISASHNPYEDNGVKVIGKNGFKLPDEWEIAIEQKIDVASYGVNANHLGSVTVIHDAVTQYVSHCVQLFEADFSLSHYKIVVDCANGATFNCAEKLFSKLGANVVLIHATPDGKNINDHCGATHLESLQARVLLEKADCGIAFDGDGDRLMMVDHLGNVVDGDEILCILAIDTVRTKSPCRGIVGTLMSNLGLEKALESHCIPFERAAVGDRYVLEKLQKNNWTLGGEGSGHIVNLEYGTTGDGIVSALQVLKIMQKTRKSLLDLKNAMQKRPQILINVPVKEPNRYVTQSDIMTALASAELHLQNRGRILLRASGTESCVRVMVECDDKKEAVTVAESLATVVRTSLG